MKLQTLKLVKGRLNTETFVATADVFSTGTIRVVSDLAGLSVTCAHVSGSGGLQATFEADATDLADVVPGTYEYMLEVEQSGQDPEALGEPGVLIVYAAP